MQKSEKAKEKGKKNLISFVFSSIYSIFAV